MAGTLVVDTLKSSTTSAPTFQNTSGTQIGTLCRAWVNWNGNGVATINQSFNVSSVTYNATGDYTINFTNAMPNANYVVAGTIGIAPTGSGWATLVIRDSSAVPTTTALRVGAVGYSAWQNSTIMNAAIFTS